MRTNTKIRTSVFGTLNGVRKWLSVTGEIQGFHDLFCVFTKKKFEFTEKHFGAWDLLTSNFDQSREKIHFLEFSHNDWSLDHGQTLNDLSFDYWLTPIPPEILNPEPQFWNKKELSVWKKKERKDKCPTVHQKQNVWSQSANSRRMESEKVALVFTFRLFFWRLDNSMRHQIVA